MPRKLNAITLTVIIVVSLFAGGTVAASELAQQTKSTAPTEITSCTVIDSPGDYALTQDIVRPEGSDGSCIEIRASDVTLEGNGHVIDGNSTNGVGIATTAANPVSNVTVANLTVRDNERNFRFTNLTDGLVTNVSSVNPEIIGVQFEQSRRVEIRDSDLEGGIDAALRVDDSEELTVVNNTLASHMGISARGMNDSEISDNVVRGSWGTIRLHSGSENVISNNTIEGSPDQAIAVGGSDNLVTGNTITSSYDGIVLSGTNHTVTNNDAGGIGWGASVEGVNHTIRNNTLSGGEAEGGSGGALEVSGSGHEIENNSLNGVHGVYVASATGPISIDDNHIRAIRHIEVAKTQLCPDPGQVVTAHGNVFDPEWYEAYQRHGVLNHDDDMVNATGNYWGASDGPSSPDGENVTDPVTGEPANGSGLPVSDGVHFDPHLEEPPANETDS